jgi:hypothetical protein
MKYRCNNPNFKQYKDYGGRGIKYCATWDSFEIFLRDMGPRPKGKTLDRIDNERGYFADNCRWATRAEQGANKRDNKIIYINGYGEPAVSWSKKSKVSAKLIRARIDRGWSPEDAVWKKPKKHWARKTRHTKQPGTY